MFLLASYLCFFTVGIGLVFILFLWLRFRKNYSRRFLILLILAFCGIEFYMYALSSKAILEMPFLYRSAFPWRFLLGPLLWLYTLSLTNPLRGWKNIDMVHFVIPVFVVINLFPDFMLATAQKLIILEQFYLQNTVLMSRSTGMLPAGFIQPISLVHGLIYCAASIIWVIRYRAKQTEMSISLNRVVWKWVSIVTGITTAFIIFQVVQWLSLSMESHFSIFAQVTQSISLIIMKAYLLIHPVLIDNMDGVIPVPIMQKNEQINAVLPVIKTSSKYAQYEIDLKHYWEEQKKFLDPEHSIGKMAEELGMSKSKLTAVFTEVYKMPYTEVINRYRINYFLEQIKKGQGQIHKLEVIIQNSGFHYRSTFYSAFKKIMGSSPKEVLKSDQQISELSGSSIR